MLQNQRGGDLCVCGGNFSPSCAGVSSPSEGGAQLVCREARFTAHRDLELRRIDAALLHGYADDDSAYLPCYRADYAEVLLAEIETLFVVVCDNDHRNSAVEIVPHARIGGGEGAYLRLGAALVEHMVDKRVLRPRIKQRCGGSVGAGGGV